jgi:uncharacterized membrane protein
MNGYVTLASFLGTSVEFIEALTIILAVGTVKGWRSALSGAALATVVLVIITAIFGIPFVHFIQLRLVQFVIGLLMLLFGMRWLRKAILRYAGMKALHDEEEAYRKELERQRKSNSGASTMDWFGFATCFQIVMLEGIEAIFIVLTFGLAAQTLTSAIAGGVIGLVMVVAAGLLLRKPLTRIPENTMKFIVGIMLSGFGIFWVGEGVDVAWWHEDLSIVVIIVLLVAISLTAVSLLKSARTQKAGERG